MLASLLAKFGIYQNPTNISDDDLEAAYLVLRKEANASSPHEENPVIYRNRTIIIRLVLDRHGMYYSDIKDAWSMINEESIINSFAESRNGKSPEHLIKNVLSDINVGHKNEEVLLYIYVSIYSITIMLLVSTQIDC